MQTLEGIKVIRRASVDPWSLTITPMDRLIAGYRVRELSQRTRVHGTITYYQPGSAVVLQDGAKSLWITTLSRNPLQIGDVADATGFPEAHNGTLALTHGEIEDSHVLAPIKPLPATWHQLAFWSSYKPDGHLFDLVSIEGQVVTEVREAMQDEYVLVADGRLFSAIYRHPDPDSHIPLSPMMQIPLGSRVRVTGICMNEEINTHNQNEELPFNILLRSFNDITVVAKPSPLNVRNLVILVGLLLVVVAVVGARGWALERKVRQKTAALAMRIEKEAAMERSSAVLEQKRSCILEDINGSQPLAQSAGDHGDGLIPPGWRPCWCEVADGSMFGNCPPEPHNLRIVRVNVEARSGPALGALFAALAPETPPAAHETDGLSNGARLATLAIETRRLYSDLRRRSEFDLLTDIYNRFSLHKRLDVLSPKRPTRKASSDLIYIDLDKFKPINDTFRPSRGGRLPPGSGRAHEAQLRPGDMLARLGGDEFAVWSLRPLPRRRGRDRPAPGTLLRSALCARLRQHPGSASVGIALFPEDADNKDALMRAADAAMYVKKHQDAPQNMSPGAH